MIEANCMICKHRNLYFCGDGVFACNNWDSEISQCKLIIAGKIKICSICNKEYLGRGYDAEPIKDSISRCCRSCKYKVVKPFIKRIQRVKR